MKVFSLFWVQHCLRGIVRSCISGCVRTLSEKITAREGHALVSVTGISTFRKTVFSSAGVGGFLPGNEHVVDRDETGAASWSLSVSNKVRCIKTSGVKESL